MSEGKKLFVVVGEYTVTYRYYAPEIKHVARLVWAKDEDEAYDLVLAEVKEQEGRWSYVDIGLTATVGGTLGEP